MAAKWNEDETQILIQVWGADAMQKKLAATMRNLEVFEKISRILKDFHGLDRTAIQCRTKIKKLRSAFNRAEDPRRTPFYDLLAPVLRNQSISEAQDESEKVVQPLLLHRNEVSAPAEPDHCDEDRPLLEDDYDLSSHSDQSTLQDMEITQNIHDSEDDDSSDALYEAQLAEDKISSQANTIDTPQDYSLPPQPIPSSTKEAPPAVPTRGRPPRKRKSPADRTKAVLESALKTFKEISREEMRAFNEAENERLEKWMQLERERQAHERLQDKMMFSFLQKAFGEEGNVNKVSTAEGNGDESLSLKEETT